MNDWTRRPLGRGEGSVLYTRTSNLIRRCPQTFSFFSFKSLTTLRNSFSRMASLRPLFTRSIQISLPVTRFYNTALVNYCMGETLLFQNFHIFRFHPRFCPFEEMVFFDLLSCLNSNISLIYHHGAVLLLLENFDLFPFPSS